MLVLPVERTWDGEPVGEAERVELRLGRLSAELLQLTVRAPYHGDPPPPGSPGSTPGLWEHEVVELFVLGAEGHYTEIELGPHGHHLVLRLHGARRVVEQGLPLAFAARVSGNRWSGHALLPRALLPQAPHHAGAFAIHGQGGARRYLAWKGLPGERPDFHQLDQLDPVTLP